MNFVSGNREAQAFAGELAKAFTAGGFEVLGSAQPLFGFDIGDHPSGIALRHRGTKEGPNNPKYLTAIWRAFLAIGPPPLLTDLPAEPGVVEVEVHSKP